MVVGGATRDILVEADLPDLRVIDVALFAYVLPCCAAINLPKSPREARLQRR